MAISAVANKVTESLGAGKRVAWVLSGGSNIKLEVEVMQQIRSAAGDKLGNLTVLLSDERYGQVGHKDSNWQQLIEAGFNFEGINAIPTLIGQNLKDTVHWYTAMVQKTFDESDVVIAQLGMGADGHIAGILPHSVAVESDEFVVGYVAPPFTRITMTPRALRRINTAYLFAYGESKKEALDNLKNKNLSLADQPAQVLKEIPEVYIYSDQM